jgi:glycosyltransferase involved in cell wall biosynthesis
VSAASGSAGRLPSITVITASYNAAGTLEATLRSVREQSYDGAVEHIVVDGGSTDGTVEILEASGLRYVSEPDRGLTHAINKGIAMARHDIVGSLNADDTYLPGALDRVGRAFAANPGAEWVTGLCPIVDGEGREIRKAVSAYKGFFLRHHSFSLHLVQNYVSAPATFVRRSALEAVGGYDERFRYSADYDMWLKLGRRGDPVVLDEPLATFQMAGETLSLTGFDQQFVEHAANARENGKGHPIAVGLNVAASRAIILVYRLMRRWGQIRAR